LPVLISAAKDAGLDENKVSEYLKSDEDKALVNQQATEAVMDMGVTGVPFFVFNDKYAVSGAQEAQTFVGIFNKIA
jgi:predicted DsbA family dithiol-disulfide isomerase